MTVEHLIPASLGGKLTSRVLCKDCNDRLGHGLEFETRLRRAAAGMAADLTGLAEALEVGARYEATFGDQKAVQKVRKGGGLGTTRLPDESLIVPDVEEPRKRKSTSRSGATGINFGRLVYPSARHRG